MQRIVGLGRWMLLIAGLGTAIVLSGGPGKTPAEADPVPQHSEALVTPADAPAYVPGQVLVAYRDPASTPSLADLQGHKRLSGAKFSVHSMERLSVPGLLKVAVTGDVPAAVAAFAADPAVRYAEPNYYRYLQRVPNEELFSSMGHLLTSRAPLGWDIRTEAKGVTVAVIDSGIDFAHPDLAPNIVGSFNVLAPEQPASDEAGHGTSVAGVVGAIGNNGAHAVGTAWNVNLLPIKACSGDLRCTVTSEAIAIDYAIAQGADIINLSVGERFHSITEQEAVERAQAAGILVVAAAGNFGREGKIIPGDPETSFQFYPADLPGVLGVGSIDAVANPEILNSVRLSSFSNFGSMTDVVAVGRSVLTVACSEPVPFPIYCNEVLAPETCTYHLSDVALVDGTSFSSPFVAGLAALLLEQFPDFTGQDLHDAIIASARDIGEQDATGRSVEFGYGLVDFFTALSGQGGAVNDAFVVTVAANPIFTNQVYVTIKQRQGLVGDVSVRVTIRQEGQPDKTIELTPSPLESDPNVRFSRILVEGAATLETEVLGTLASNLEVRRLAVAYTKEK